MQKLIDNFAESPVYNCTTTKDVGHYIKGLSVPNILLVTDTNAYKHCYDMLAKALPAHQLLKLPAGEKNKTLASAEKIWDKLVKMKAGKDALIIALGGGVVTDICGFAASVYKRGIPVVYIPTTLMAQADAAIGGKTGLDWAGIKNTLGSFYFPEALLIHQPFLKSLPENQYNNGVAELIKIGAVAHVDLFYHLVGKKVISADMITAAIKTKCTIVNEDTTDEYLRHILNYGHTIGHAIESAYLDTKKPLLHGEAVALGMICETYLSYSKLGLPVEELDDMLFVLSKWDLIRPHVYLEAIAKNIISYCKQDKKNTGTTVQCVLLQTLGAPVIDVEINDTEIRQALIYADNYMRSL